MPRPAYGLIRRAAVAFMACFSVKKRPDRWCKQIGYQSAHYCSRQSSTVHDRAARALFMEKQTNKKQITVGYYTISGAMLPSSGRRGQTLIVHEWSFRCSPSGDWKGSSDPEFRIWAIEKMEGWKDLRDIELLYSIYSYILERKTTKAKQKVNDIRCLTAVHCCSTLQIMILGWRTPPPTHTYQFKYFPLVILLCLFSDGAKYFIEVCVTEQVTSAHRVSVQQSNEKKYLCERECVCVSACRSVCRWSRRAQLGRRGFLFWGEYLGCRPEGRRESTSKTDFSAPN